MFVWGVKIRISKRVWGSIIFQSMDKLARFDSAILHLLISLRDPEVAIGQHGCGDTRVLRTTHVQGGDNFVPGITFASRPPMLQWMLTLCWHEST